MRQILTYIDQLPWAVVLLVCLTLGLAPFSPPHLWEKAQWLMSGKPLKAIDWFDVAYHGAPWLVALVKLIRSVAK